MADKADRLEKLMAEMLEIYKAKNKDYGDSFSESFEELGLIAPIVRMNDKMNRIKSLTKKGDRQVKDESLRDSLMDLANYALMTVVELDQEVEKEEKEKEREEFRRKMETTPLMMKNNSCNEEIARVVKEELEKRESDYEAGRQENL